MAYWTSFGASVIGPGHLSTRTPNQDSWSAFHRSFCDGIVVSDGVGSKGFSHFGSAAACMAVERAAFSMWINESDALDEDFLDDVRDYWIEHIAPLEPRSAAATCLFGIIFNSMVWIGLLGDGCAAVIRKDGRVTILSDDKTGSFSNVAEPLSATVSADKWKLACIPESECEAVVLCTDGVSDDIVGDDNLRGFLKGFVESSSEMATISATKAATEMLENWPTPKHTDDKTIACLLKNEVEDE
ncbi:MAG: protein phosphatase 2C domain-containing protein [Eggerthellaceae bacterium]|nr:protein phosphatase 2C domain-containing protein [Eggerthellaceae bacterium]